jgi:anti-sigma-K factor RskA
MELTSRKTSSTSVEHQFPFSAIIGKSEVKISPFNCTAQQAAPSNFDGMQTVLVIVQVPFLES